jgi:vitamin B12 transporter
MRTLNSTALEGGELSFSRPKDEAAGNFFAWLPGGRSRPATPIVILILCLAITAGLSQPIMAQTMAKAAGYIFDAVDGHPLSRAEVRVEGSDYKTLSDQFGHFVLEHIPAGHYRLEVTSEGYKPVSAYEIEVITGVTQRVAIYLQRDIYNLGERKVTGRFAPLNISSMEVIEYEEIQRSGARTITEVLNRLEGVYVQDSGPVGSKKQVSIRGSAPKHVLVLIDGQRINPAASGDADLGSIPLEVVEKVEVYRGGQSSQFGADALGGVVNIITQISRPQDRTELTARKYWGKWNTDLHNITIINPLKFEGLTSKFTYGHRETKGNFDYLYSPLPHQDVNRIYTGTRFNADFESRNFYASTLYQPGKETSLRFSGQVYYSRHGLPGGVSRPDPTARKDDRRLLGSLRFQHNFSLRHNVETSLGFTRLYQAFKNPAGLQPYESRYINDIASLQTINRARLWKGNELSGGINLQRDILYHDEIITPANGMGRTVRDNIGFFGADRQTVDLHRLPFWDIATMDVSIRWDNTNTKRDAASSSNSLRAQRISNWSQKIGASISRGDNIRLVLRGSYGKSYRLPSINALFWKSDVPVKVNPDVRPERSEHSEAGIEISTDGPVKMSAGITYFHSYVTDLIIWRPSSPMGIWRPENLKAALITGHEDFVRVGLFSERLRLSYRNTIIAPLNKSGIPALYNKFLTFRPHYVTNLDCEMRFWILQGGYRIRLVDIRYLLDANTKWYGAYRIDDADFGFRGELSRFTIEAGYQVKNLRGAQYELIAHYPMPGREWGVNLSISYRVE